MRTLNRPMFRMGGPIKEGVMNGIREPKNMGGRMLLVGQHPKQFRDKGGREHHVAPLALAAPAAWTAARAAAMRLAPRAIRGIKSLFGKTVKTPAPFSKVTPRTKMIGEDIYKTTMVPGGAGPTANIASTTKFVPNWLGRDPLVRTVGATGKAIFNPTVGGAAAKAARFATSPSVLLGGAAYMFWPDGTPKTQAELLDTSGIQSQQKGPPGGGDRDMGYVDPEKAKKLAAKKRDERVTNLLETMGYDAAKKDAVSKALIDASQIVSERGTLDKKNITAELINPIIQATSKRLEKPEQLNEAVRLMMTKAEIEKEMNPLKNEALRMQIAASKKTLKGKTISETIAEAAGKNTPLTGETLAASARALLPGDFKVMQLKVPKKTDTLEYIIDVVKDSHTDPEKTPFPPGQYILKERIVQIDEQGNVTPLDI